MFCSYSLRACNVCLQLLQQISFISATFGDDLWSVKGAGLARVQSAVKVRQGNSVTLVLESTNESKAKIAKAVSDNRSVLQLQ
jgi:hypothetical protein